MSLSEDQILLNDAVRRWLHVKYDFDSRNTILHDSGFSEAVWAEFAEMGWLGVPFSEALGGFGGGATELTILAENFGSYLVIEPYLSSVVLAGGLIEALAPNDLKQDLLSRIISGDLRIALAHAEGRHFEIKPNSTIATTAGGNWRVSGKKQNVLDVPAANMMIVSAVSADNGLTQLFLVDSQDIPNSAKTLYRLVDGRPAADILFDNTPAILPHDADLDAIDALRSVFERASLYIAAEMIGSMQSLIKATLSYIQQRQQFGQTLIQSQVIQHNAVDMQIALVSARALVTRAARESTQQGSQASRLISAAKAEVGRLATFVAQRSIQLHGGIGMTDELDVGHFYKRIITDATLFGSSNHHWLQMAQAE